MNRAIDSRILFLGVAGKCAKKVDTILRLNEPKKWQL
jgi:hypothetical protein